MSFTAGLRMGGFSLIHKFDQIMLEKIFNLISHGIHIQQGNSSLLCLCIVQNLSLIVCISSTSLLWRVLLLRPSSVGVEASERGT